MQAFSQSIREADSKGDFERAAHAAEQCLAVVANDYCKLYLSSSLRTGRGVPRDEERAFAILQNLVATDRDSDAALSLAEAYLDGVGTSRDPIEAAVILWRVQHGAWSIYNDYWGMCIE